MKAMRIRHWNHRLKWALEDDEYLGRNVHCNNTSIRREIRTESSARTRQTNPKMVHAAKRLETVGDTGYRG